jgi:hypothetical protein
VQRKLGTTRGSPRRSRTAKASRISRRAVKSRCAREWGGWGQLSDDGPGHYNPDPSEGPGVGGAFHPWRCSNRASKAMNFILNGTTLSARDQLLIAAVILAGVLSAVVDLGGEGRYCGATSGG